MSHPRIKKPPPRLFLLSPAKSGGERARMLLRPGASFELAKQVQSPEGAALGDVFTFASGLYFRGKRAYTERFARVPRGCEGGFVITPGRGLLSLRERVTAADLSAFAQVPIDEREKRYRAPLERDVTALAEALGPEGEVVLLGSVASGKYTAVLQAILGDRLQFPIDFVGRGDMSRGGLLLRCVRAGVELEYQPVRSATVRGTRPPKLPRVPTSAQTVADVPEVVRSAWRKRKRGRAVDQA